MEDSFRAFLPAVADHLQLGQHNHCVVWSECEHVQCLRGFSITKVKKLTSTWSKRIIHFHTAVNEAKKSTDFNLEEHLWIPRQFIRNVYTLRKPPNEQMVITVDEFLCRHGHIDPRQFPKLKLISKEALSFLEPVTYGRETQMGNVCCSCFQAILAAKESAQHDGLAGSSESPSTDDDRQGTSAELDTPDDSTSGIDTSVIRDARQDEPANASVNWDNFRPQGSSSFLVQKQHSSTTGANVTVANSTEEPSTSADSSNRIDEINFTKETNTSDVSGPKNPDNVDRAEEKRRKLLSTSSNESVERGSRGTESRDRGNGSGETRGKDRDRGSRSRSGSSSSTSSKEQSDSGRNEKKSRKSEEESDEEEEAIHRTHCIEYVARKWKIYVPKFQDEIAANVHYAKQQGENNKMQYRCMMLDAKKKNCTKVYTSHHAIIAHILEHEKEKYYCYYCSQPRVAIGARGNYTRHLKIAHPKVYDAKKNAQSKTM